MYQYLLEMDGEMCYSLIADEEAGMRVDEDGVTILLPSGKELLLPRKMIDEAINRLKRNRMLTGAEIHEEITGGDRQRTDRLMAVLRKLPGVSYDRRPRAVYLLPR